MTNTNLKHVFVIHSAITNLVTKLIIRQLKLDLNNVYIICRDSSYALALETVPARNIINCQELMHMMIPTDKVNERGVLDSILLARLFAQILDTAFNRNSKELNTQELFVPISTQATKFYDREHPPVHNKFIAYVPHIADLITNVVCKLPNCVQVNYIEEGTLNYIDVDYYNHELTPMVAKYLETNPEFTYATSGVNFYQEYTLYNFKDLEKEHPFLRNKDSKYYVLTKDAFAYFGFAPERVVLLDANLLKDKTAKSQIEELRKQTFAKHPELKANHDGLNQYINVIIFEGQGSITDNSKFNEYSLSLVQKVIDAGVKYALCKFHPLSTEAVRESLREKLRNLDIVLDEIPDSVSLEQEASILPERTCVFHGIQSSALIYACVFGQAAKCYQEILDHDAFLQNYKKNHSFDMKKIVANVSKFEV
ncbi:polysialyltransferase family glycosyltransferase [Psittacicella gerlachiana]|uniref:Uncharacterized protein n=1 Tax=Psittacicella gerlachiana TaxID=2028574 RepID=A0A3A1YA37_9GAMM|nr:polysialyltransferase family glycosyltransferase [Psittacicella gerlachiana]RIY35022.1 hypothetical protein CKF59_04260 [Psittacicella gerlachiana]